MNSRYETTVDPLAPNDARALALQMIGSGKRVLELGAASGFVSRALRERGNTVVAVEADANLCDELAASADEVVICDLNWLDLTQRFHGRDFDVVLMGDVLEHCIDPDLVLLQAHDLLTPAGHIIVSLPNIAHVDVRLSLLAGAFDYRPTGLLDRTHVRFFTRRSVEDLLTRNGFRALEWHATVAPLGTTEIGPPPPEIPRAAVDFAVSDRDAAVYQFVVKAEPADVPSGRRAGTPIDPVTSRRQLLGRVSLLGELVAQRDATLRAAETEISRLASELNETQRALAAKNVALHATRSRHRDEISRIHGSRWWRTGTLLRRPWLAVQSLPWRRGSAASPRRRDPLAAPATTVGGAM